MFKANHLVRRGNAFQYRRRVPKHLINAIGKPTIQLSLGTSDLREARKRCAAEDLKWTRRFEAAETAVAASDPAINCSPNPLSEREVIRLVQDHVERTDERSRKRLVASPPDSAEQKAEIAQDIEYALGILRNPDDPRADEWVYRDGKEILSPTGRSIDDPGVPYAVFAEWVRRGLMEYEQRRLARIRDNYSHPFFDQAFGPRRPDLTFGELADQFMQMTEEEADANGTSRKWVDNHSAQRGTKLRDHRFPSSHNGATQLSISGTLST